MNKKEQKTKRVNFLFSSLYTKYKKVQNEKRKGEMGKLYDIFLLYFEYIKSEGGAYR